MAIDNSDPSRDAIHQRIQELGPQGDDDGLGDGRAAVLTGWVLVCEWMDETGERWLSKTHSASLANWSANGFHHEALHGNWPADEDES